jgi:photosystem II stability/assembly factor-like uncharacterized protein
MNERTRAVWVMALMGMAAGCSGAGSAAAGGGAATQPSPGAAKTGAAPAQPSGAPAKPAASVATSESLKSAGAPATGAPGGVRVLRPEDFKGLAWRSIGPANMGGRVAEIAIAPGQGGAKTFYVGFGTSGLFKTANNGTTFSPLMDKEVTASIGSVVVCNAPPEWPGWKAEEEKDRGAAGGAAGPEGGKDEKDKGKAKIVWVGTGEGNGRNSSSWGNGVYRSTDGGGTFANVGLTDSHDIPRLAVDPRNPDVCYAAALGHLWGANEERGVYKTSDGGRTWAAVLKIDKDTGCCDVMVDPTSPGTVYAAMYMRRRTAWSYRSGGPKGGIYRSDDAGATWKKLAGGLPAQTGRIGLDIYAKDPRIVYAVVESDLGGEPIDLGDERSRAGGVFRSEDRGETWARVSDRTPRAFYFSKVKMDPTNDQRVYLLGFTLYVSDDGGRHWRAGGAKRPHGDMHALVIDPSDPKHLIMGTDGGVYVSYDGAATWDFLNSMAVGEFYNIATDMSEPYRIGGGLQDNGSWMGPSASWREMSGDKPGERGGGISNQDWQFVCGGDGYHFAFDPFDANVIYAESQGGGIIRHNLSTRQMKVLKPAPKEGQPRHRFNWNTPFFASPHCKAGEPGGTVLYLGGNYVFKLTEGGDKWERISPDLSTRAIEKIETVGSEAETHGTVVSLAESPVARGMLWAGTDDGLIHVTTDDGKTWANITPAEVQGKYISEIEPSHHDRNIAYVAVDGHRGDDMLPHVIMTSDAGKSWRDVTGDLPAITGSVQVVKEDRWNPRVLFAGTERGMFVTIDGGERWVRMNGESLPTVAVDDLVEHPREADLVAATHGRSIWILDDASFLSQLTPEVVQEEVHLFDVKPATPHQVGPYEGFWDERQFRGANPEPGARITYWLREYPGDEVKITVEDAKGTPVRELKGPQRPGLNRVAWDLQAEETDRLSDPDSQLGQKQFVPPGEYKVTLTCGKRKASTTVVVGKEIGK